MRHTLIFVFAVGLLLNAVPALAGQSVPPTVPEPATLLLLGTGLAAAAYRRRRKL